MTDPVRRKLAAILAADAVGYSRMMGADEEGTLRVLAGHRSVIDGVIALHRGRIVGTAGDSVLAEFESAVEAVRCAVEIQDALKTKNLGLPEGERMQFRIGVNLGDVMVTGDNLHGDGVNVAARLESIAEPGGICVSSSVYDQISGKLDLGFVDIGNQELKNISRPIHVYQIAGTTPAKRTLPAAAKAAAKVAAKTPRASRWAIAAGGIVAIAALAAWQMGWLGRSSSPELEAELAKARAAAEDAKREAQSQADAAAKANRELEAQRAAELKAKAETELARAQADAATIRRKADAELAAAKQAAARQAIPAAQRFGSNWTATGLCEAFEELPQRTLRWKFSTSGNDWIVSGGQEGQPGYLVMRGTPADDGSLALTGKVIARSKRFYGQEAPVFFDGKYDGSRFVLKGRIGRRGCSMVLARAGG